MSYSAWSFIVVPLFFVLSIIACSEKQVAPAAPAAPAWCDEATEQIAGRWQRRFTSRDHEYIAYLSFVATEEPCRYRYIFIAEELHDDVPRRVQAVEGIVLTTAAQVYDDLSVITFEVKRTSLIRYPEEGEPVAEDAEGLYETSEAKVWGDVMSVWDVTYHRVE